MASATAASDVLAIKSNGAAVVALRTPPGDKWMARVSRALKPRRVVFGWSEEGGLSVTGMLDGAKAVVGADERKVAEKLALGATRVTGTRRVDRVRSPDALSTLIDDENQATLEALAVSLRSSTGVIPFVGAGMCRSFNLPLWDEFLRGAARSERQRKAVDRHLAKSDYEAAAEVFMAPRSKKRFNELVEKTFDVDVPEADFRASPLRLLPLVTSGPLVTTNFDCVLEQLFALSSRPFAQDDVIIGRRPERILAAMQHNERALIKLHGDISDRSTRTFTAWEYEQSYGEAGGLPTGILLRLSNVLYTNRPMLFLGCSLEADRTVKVLTRIRAQNPYLTHYAILAADDLASAFDAKRKRLARCGIRPLWFAPEDFLSIATLLERCVDLASVDALPSRPFGPRAAPPQRKRNATPRWRSPGLTDPHVDAVAAGIADGRVAFFLGAGVHDEGLLGSPFYEELARRTGATVSRDLRSRVADYLAATVGHALLSQKVEEIIREYVQTRDVIHDLIAGLPRALERSGRSPIGPLLAFTTNYDDVLERTFEEAGTQYHFFLYRPDDVGFVHRTPDGVLRRIRRPDGVHRLVPEAPVIVKFNGGVDPAHELPPSVAVATSDFSTLARAIPGVLPGAVRTMLSERSLLFLGHGLNEDDVRALATFSKAQRRIPESWAVVRPDWAHEDRKADEDFWCDVAGVEIVLADLAAYMPALLERLADGYGVR
jgi:hypothetical protein